MKKTFALVVCLLLGVLEARAQTGDELSKLCQTNRPLVVGYVAGVLDKATADSDVLFHFYFDTFEVNKDAAKIANDNRVLIASSDAIDGYCIPRNATLERKVDAFCEYLSNNPDQRHNDAVKLLGEAERAEWPCK
jgi:hypothetical protein